jgi:hypothetical protein
VLAGSRIAKTVFSQHYQVCWVMDMELTEPQKDTLRKARTLIRDLVYGWSQRELADRPETIVQEINEILGESWDFHKGDFVKGDFR